MNNDPDLKFLDKEDRIIRTSLLDLARCAGSIGKGYSGTHHSDSRLDQKEDSARAKLRSSAVASIHSAWEFCRDSFASGEKVDIRTARNNSSIEASVGSWWELKEWILQYRYSDGGNYLIESLHGYCRNAEIVLPRLGITFGSCEGEIYNTSVFFDNQFRPEWMNDELNRKMILHVDRSEVMGEYSIKSPVLGNISPFILSGGVKTLILMHEMPDRIYNASNCGDNCARWILKIARDQDIDITLHHIMYFERERLDLYITNVNKSVSSRSEYVDLAIDNLR